MEVDATQISTPLDNVPLYSVKPSVVSIMLLKSSHAVSSSERFRFGTPVDNKLGKSRIFNQDKHYRNRI